MQCSGCGYQNSDNVGFCNECGVSLGALPPQLTEIPPVTYTTVASPVNSYVNADFEGRQRDIDNL